MSEAAHAENNAQRPNQNAMSQDVLLGERYFARLSVFTACPHSCRLVPTGYRGFPRDVHDRLHGFYILNKADMCIKRSFTTCVFTFRIQIATTISSLGSHQLTEEGRAVCAELAWISGKHHTRSFALRSGVRFPPFQHTREQ